MTDGGETPQKSTIWKMLHADDSAIVSRSPTSMAKMMTAVVEACGAHGLTMAERKTGRVSPLCQRRLRPTHHDRIDDAKSPNAPSGGSGALLYGCSTWMLLSREYGMLCTQQDGLLLRCVVFRKSQRSEHPLLYATNVVMTGCERVETTIR